MRVNLRPRRTGEIEHGIIYGALAVLALAAARFLPVRELLPACTFRAALGMPCPTCGTTRSLIALAHGDVGSAFSLNPLLSLLVITAIVLFLANMLVLAFRLPRPALILTRNEGTAVRVAALVVLLLNWMFLVLSDR